MSYLTEYFDEFRERPIRKTAMVRPESRWAKLDGKWLDPKKGTSKKEMTDEEIQEFIAKTMKAVRGQSTYFNEHCAYLDQDFKTRPFVPQKKKLRPCKEPEKGAEPEEETLTHPAEPKLALKDTEVMKMAQELYEQDMDKPTLEPLPTHFRILGYVRPCHFKTGISDYQGGIAKLAYTLVRDNRLPRYQKSNGHRPVWGYPPEGVRQPLLDGIPLDGERLF